jgi:hypothetical protein
MVVRMEPPSFLVMVIMASATGALAESLTSPATVPNEDCAFTIAVHNKAADTTAVILFIAKCGPSFFP